MYLRNSQVISLVKGELGCCLPSMGSRSNFFGIVRLECHLPSRGTLAVISSTWLNWDVICPEWVDMK